MSKIKKFFSKFSKINKANYLVILIILVLCISVVVPSLARFKNRTTIYGETVWDGTVASSYRKGSGTQVDPYVISNGSELAYFSKMLESTDYSNTYFTLSNDIVLNNGIFSYDETNGIEYTLSNTKFYVKEYTNSFYDNINRENSAIGTVNIFNSLNGFKGIFDGDYHSIYGLYITNNNDNLGLFTNLEGQVKNLYVSNSMIYGGNVTGGIVSNATNTLLNNIMFDGSVVGKKEDITKNVTNNLEDKALTINNDTKEETIKLNLPVIEGNIISKKLKGNVLIEGNGTIEINGIPVNNDFEIDLTSLDNIVISYSSQEEATFKLTNLTYNIDSNLSTSGGIVAVGNNVTLNNVINKSYVYGNTISGGLIGQTNGSVVKQSYNTGNVVSANISGGLIGDISQSENTSVNKSYNTGEITGTISGGIVGNIDNNTGNINIENTFNTTDSYTINTINNSNVIINNLLYTGLSVNKGTTTNELTPTTIDNLKNKTYLINNLGLFEFIDSEDVINNNSNVWIYDDGIPILYIDDIVNPIANIHVGSYTWNNFSTELNPIKFKSQVAFSIEQADTLRPIKEMYYYISNGNTPLNKSDMETLEWQPYTNIIDIDTEGIYIIYAKVVDYNGNITYLNTDTLIYDTSKATSTITIKGKSYDTLRSELNDIYIGEPTNFTIEAVDELSGIASIKYYITSELLDEEALNNLEQSNWIDYKENSIIDTKGKNIVYVKVVDNCDYITYINSDYINYSGYDEVSLKAGDNIDADKVYITDKSSISLNVKYTDTLEYKKEYTHNLISNVLLPINTKITLIDKITNKTYTYKINTEEDIFNYNNSCTEEGCTKYATYPFTLFSEVGKTKDNLFKESYSGNINEDFVIIVDFAETTINNNYENINLYLELREGNEVIIPTLKDSIKSFSIYKKDTIKPYISTDYSGTVEYNSDSTSNINLNIGLSQDSIENIKLTDTTYENKNLGIGIKLVDGEGNIVSKNYLKNIKFKIEDNIYTPENDGVVRINLNNGILDTTKTLTIETSQNGLKLPSGTYYFKIYSYASYDGKYSNIHSQELSIPVNVKSTVINDNYKFNVNMKNTIKNTNKKIDLNIDYEGNLSNPNIRISLYKKYELTAYNQDYMMLDLANYIMDDLEIASDKIYYLTKDVKPTNNIVLNIGEFSGGGYSFVFELYDGDNRISTIEKKFIVRY